MLKTGDLVTVAVRGEKLHDDVPAVVLSLIGMGTSPVVYRCEVAAFGPARGTMLMAIPEKAISLQNNEQDPRWDTLGLRDYSDIEVTQ